MQKLPLLLLPGTLCDATLFEYQLKHLTDVATPQVVDIHYARLIALDDCGHLTALEKPDLTTKALRDWLIGDGIWR